MYNFEIDEIKRTPCSLVGHGGLYWNLLELVLAVPFTKSLLSCLNQNINKIFDKKTRFTDQHFSTSLDTRPIPTAFFSLSFETSYSWFNLILETYPSCFICSNKSYFSILFLANIHHLAPRLKHSGYSGFEKHFPLMQYMNSIHFITILWQYL